MNVISITLSAGSVGPWSTEADFDRWASFVANNIGADLGIEVDIDQYKFGIASEDRISGADNFTLRDEVRSWLRVDGWNKFCAEDDGRLVIVTLDGGAASDADAALAVDLNAYNTRWGALVRSCRVAELVAKTGATIRGEPSEWDGSRYGDGSGTVERREDGVITGTGCYDAAWIANHA